MSGIEGCRIELYVLLLHRRRCPMAACDRPVARRLARALGAEADEKKKAIWLAGPDRANISSSTSGFGRAHSTLAVEFLAAPVQFHSMRVNHACILTDGPQTETTREEAAWKRHLVVPDHTRNATQRADVASGTRTRHGTAPRPSSSAKRDKGPAQAKAQCAASRRGRAKKPKAGEHQVVMPACTYPEPGGVRLPPLAGSAWRRRRARNGRGLQLVAETRQQRRERPCGRALPAVGVRWSDWLEERRKRRK